MHALRHHEFGATGSPGARPSAGCRVPHVGSVLPGAGAGKTGPASETGAGVGNVERVTEERGA
jgi:hypothetical protein